MTPDEIKKWLYDEGIESLDNNQYIALRADDSHNGGTKSFKKSYNWPNGRKTTRLPGTCAVMLSGEWVGGDFPDTDMCFDDSFQKVKKYGSTYYMCIGEKHPDSDWLANDEWNDEIILVNTKIIARIIG